MTATRRPELAVLLSLIAPGLGHLYVGRPRAALTVAVGTPIGGWLVLALCVVLPPSWLLILVGFLTVLGILVAVAWHAALAARRAGSSYELRPYNRWYGYLIAFALLAMWNWAANALARAHVAQAYRIPSEAMKPALLQVTSLWWRSSHERTALLARAPLSSSAP